MRYFPGACTHDMYDYMGPQLMKLPDYIILQVGKNEALNNFPSREVLDKFLKLKTYIQKEPTELQNYSFNANLTIRNHWLSAN